MIVALQSQIKITSLLGWWGGFKLPQLD